MDRYVCLHPSRHQCPTASVLKDGICRTRNKTQPATSLFPFFIFSLPTRNFEECLCTGFIFVYIFTLPISALPVCIIVDKAL